VDFAHGSQIWQMEAAQLKGQLCPDIFGSLQELWSNAAAAVVLLRAQDYRF
jgi:hypothetical protein